MANIINTGSDREWKLAGKATGSTEIPLPDDSWSELKAFVKVHFNDTGETFVFSEIMAREVFENTDTSLIWMCGFNNGFGSIAPNSGRTSLHLKKAEIDTSDLTSSATTWIYYR